jgi:hypothetical protein
MTGGYRQTWISPRRDAENATAMGERMAGDYERDLGRPLTPAELAAVHEQARRVAAEWGSHARRVAARESELGRPLTPGELAEEIRRTNREHETG